MISFTWQEELSRRRCYSMLDSRETFQLIGVLSFKEFRDPQYRWNLFVLLCRSSRGNYVLAKEMHQFPGDSWDEPLGCDSFYSLDLIDLTQEEADECLSGIQEPLKDLPFQRPPLYV